MDSVVNATAFDMDFNITDLITPISVDFTNITNSSQFISNNFTALPTSVHVANATATAHVSNFKAFSVVIKVVYAIGIIGNAAAIVALRRGERRVRNRKHLLLLTSLAVNDLVALVGMMCAMLASEHAPGVGRTRAYCAARVVLRTFGIGSVCIAVTMALERYLALTRPFLYQKQVTYYVIRTALLVSWCWAAALTCAPVLGVGLYYDEPGRACVRYRNATQPMDLAYAAVYVLFGTVLCIILVYCNLAVISALYAITTPRGAAPLVRRVSRTSCRQRQRSVTIATGQQPMHHNAATAEEVAFSRLMATLSVLFMICWLPQMENAAKTVILAITYSGFILVYTQVTSALYLALGPAYWARLVALGRLSDVLMLLNYVLDPVLYVLMRRRKPLATLCHSIARCFKRSHKSSSESVSMKTTTCCAPETVVVSESSQAEGRPLRPLPSTASLTPPPPACPTAALLQTED